MLNTLRNLNNRPDQLRRIVFSVAVVITIGIESTGSIASTVAPKMSCNGEKDTTPIQHFKNNIISTFCTQSKNELTLSFNTKTGRLMVSNGERKNTLEIVDHRYNPEIVGGQKYIRFLPAALQVYQQSGVIMYLSATRSTGGGGGGQCGSGMEVFLNALNVKTNHRIAHILVDSCIANIELSGFTGSRDKIDAFRAINNKLEVNFLTYRNMPDGVIGRLSSDYSTIEVD